MVEKMYWAARCENCGGMVGYRDVKYSVDAGGVKAEEHLPAGTTKLHCDHCGAVGVFDLCRFQLTPVKLLIPRLPLKL